MPLLACKQLPGVSAQKLLSATSAMEQGKAAPDGVDPDVQTLARAFYHAERRKTRNERITIYLSIGSFLVAAAGLWVMWRKAQSDEAHWSRD